MSNVSNKANIFRQASLVTGVGATVAAGVLLYRQQIVAGFLLGFIGLSLIAAAETDIDVTQKLGLRSFGRLLRGRSYISTLGQLCNIASYFCLGAAFISWIVLR